MSKPWDATKPQSRLYLAAAAAGSEGISRDALMAAVADVSRSVVHKALWHLQHRGYLQRVLVGTDVGGLRVVPGSPAPDIPGLLQTAARAADAVADLGDLALAASKLIAGRDSGSDSGTLATALRCTVAEIDQALLPAVLDHKLMTCSLVRHGVQLTLYRMSSAGVAGYDWRTQARATWDNRRGELNAMLGARAAVAVPAPQPAPPPPPASNPALSRIALAAGSTRAPSPRPTKAPAPEVANEVLDAVPPAPTATPVPYAGELNIDDVHKRLPPGVTTREGGRSMVRRAIAETEDASEFLAALYSSGVLLVKSDDQRIELPLKHTRRLLRYLDGLRSSEVLDNLTGEPS